MLGFRWYVTAVVMASVFSAGTSAGAVSEAKAPLVGTWRTDVVSQADAEATLRRTAFRSGSRLFDARRRSRSRCRSFS